MKNKINYIYLSLLISFIIVFIPLIIYLSINNGANDLNISKSIVLLPYGNRYSLNIFGRIFEVIGEIPIYIILSIGVLSLGYIFKDKFNNQKVNYLIVAISILLSSLSYLYALHQIEKYICLHLGQSDSPFAELLSISLVINFVIGCILSILEYLLINRIKPNKDNLFKYSITILVVSIISLFLIEAIIKGLVHRIRFRAMWVIGDSSYTLFTPWYQKGPLTFDIAKELSPTYIKDDFVSFPSGHSAWASSTICFSLLPLYFSTIKKNKLLTSLLIILPIIYTSLVMFSRVLVGAHFLSDTLWGVCIYIVLLTISHLLVNKIIFIRTNSYKRG